MRRLWELPHHDGSESCVSNPYPELGETLSVFLQVPHGAGTDQACLRVVRDGEPLFVTAKPDRRDGGHTWFRADLTIHNPVTNYRWLLDGGRYDYRWLTAGGLSEHDVTDASDFKVTTHPPPPEWAADAVVYQVFCDRFAKAVDRPAPDWAIPQAWDDPVVGRGPETPYQLYGGDLDGVAAHLDHVAAVGADVVYLTPVFPAGSNHRYDAATFDRVDPLLCGDEALRRLAEAAHRRGMRVLADLTTNHSGNTHQWFSAARDDPASVEAEFFLFREHPDDYESWLGVPTLPKFDHRSPELRRRLYEGPDSVVARWLQAPFNLDGWRIDVANMTGRYAVTDLNHLVATTIRATMAQVRPDSLLIAEHCHDGSGDLMGSGWHGTMNYAGFTRPVWTWLAAPDSAELFLGLPVATPRLPGPHVVATVAAFAAAVPWRTTLHNFNLLGSHDTPRVRTVFRDPRHVAVGVGLLATLPGIPMLYAGDEIGLEGVNGEDGRRPFPWDRSRWDTATYDAVRALLGARRESVALRRGGLRWVAADDDVLVYLRQAPGEQVLVQAARGPHPAVRLPAAAFGGGGALAGLAGTADLGPGPDGALVLPDDGPAVRLWSVPQTS
ncbi:maltodextrin glucosidase [soil metagenome]